MISIKKAIYIKLGESAKKWDIDSITNNKIRFGWEEVPLKIIKAADWGSIRQIIDDDFNNRGKKSGATNDFNALKNICEADEETVFITFYAGKLHWCIPKSGSISEDTMSRFIETKDGWSFENISKNRIFEMNQISGRLTKYQSFMGTSCSINNRLNELDYLITIINGKESDEYNQLLSAKNKLKEAIIPAIRNLIPRDFEILVDLIFRNSGWKRTSVLGKETKFFDLVLEEVFSKKLHGVQIKSESNYTTFRDYADTFLSEYKDSFDSFFFAVHTPDHKLENHVEDNEKIKLLRVTELADLSIESGLISWIMDKSR